MLEKRSPRSLRVQSLRRAAAIALLLAGPATSVSAQMCAATVQRIELSNAQTVGPVDIRNAGDDRLFIVEQEGQIRIYKNGGMLLTPFLDIRNLVLTSPERGLLSLAFHPDYPETPYFYVLYTNEDANQAAPGAVIVARYQVSPNPDVAYPGGDILFAAPHPISNHNGGQLHFGPNDGFLYISIGDGGIACDTSPPGCNAQRDELLLGKLLRIDVNQNLEAPPLYGIPSGNPYLDPNHPRPNDPNDPRRDEIWAKGLRNPFRFSFDSATGDLWIGDVGQNAREEINFQPASSEGGENYGWKFMEGTLCNTCDLDNCSTVTPIPCNSPQLTMPVHDYGRSVGEVIIGGYVYHGTLIPDLDGCYVFGDPGAQRKIWALDPEAPATRHALADSRGLTTFGLDRAGELYAAIDEVIYRILPPGPTMTPTPTRTPNLSLTVTPTWTTRPTRTRTRTPTSTPSPMTTTTQPATAFLAGLVILLAVLMASAVRPQRSLTWTTRVKSGRPHHRDEQHSDHEGQ